MTRLLLKLPWFVSAPAILALAAVLAVAANWLMSPEFERSFLDEADPLAAASGIDAVPSPSATAEAIAPEPTSSDATPAVIREGAWRDGEPGHNGAGIARIIRTAEGNLVLRVEEFSVTNGPDLFVVLSPSADGYADGSLNLGGLKATDGNFNYEIPAGTDIAPYKSVVVWCRSFDITFAVATLEEV